MSRYHLDSAQIKLSVRGGKVRAELTAGEATVSFDLAPDVAEALGDGMGANAAAARELGASDE
jgi:hypothetical protein